MRATKNCEGQMSMGTQRLRVLIIGGGIGGLCLAQGLRRAGIESTVYERDESAAGRRQGYRLRISAEGELALRDCLPQAGQELLVATANARHEPGLDAYDENLVPQWAPSFPDPRGDRPDRVDAVDRTTLRRVLLAGLDDIVHFGKTFERYEVRADGRVTAYFDDGTSDTGDVLVAADGTNSRVRAQYRPDERPRDLGVRTIFSRIPMAAIDASIPDVLRYRFSYVIGSDGYHFGLMPMVFKTQPAHAAEKLWPGLKFPESIDYYMSVFNVHSDELGMPDAEFFALSGTQLCQLVLDRTAHWRRDLGDLFRHAEPAETFGVALRATMPIVPWESDVVVPLGDAVHTMPPSGGVGANTAVRDASGLTRALVSASAGEQSLQEAVSGYQKAMVEYATDAVQLSLRIAKWSIKKIDVEPDE